MNEQNIIEEYVLTVDGPDCTGKTTIWTKLVNEGYSANIRGIVSNIAYGLKYGRDINGMIEEYNKHPLNYMVLIPRLGVVKRVELICSRLSDIANTDKCNTVEDVRKELTDLANTMDDMEYFTKALKILDEAYKGKILPLYVNTNIDDITSLIYTAISNDSKIIATNNIQCNKSDYVIKLRCQLNKFETLAKQLSEYKKIVLFEQESKKDTIGSLYTQLDDEHQAMFNILNNIYSDESIYDLIEKEHKDITLDTLTEFLDCYTLEIDVKAKLELETNDTHYVTLYDMASKFKSIDEYIESHDCQQALYNDIENRVTDYEFDSIDYSEVR